MQQAFAVPGVSLHREMTAFEEAGPPRSEAIFRQTDGVADESAGQEKEFRHYLLQRASARISRAPYRS